MTVKDLITKLLDCDMNDEVEVLTNTEEGKFRSYSIIGVKDERVYRSSDNGLHVYLYTFKEIF